MADSEKRMRESRIECVQWEPRKNDPAVWMTVSAGDDSFRDYVLESKGLLQRVITDECRLSYTSRDGRRKLVEFRYLKLTSCSVVLLTALHLLCASTVQPSTQYYRAYISN